MVPERPVVTSPLALGPRAAALRAVCAREQPLGRRASSWWNSLPKQWSAVRPVPDPTRSRLRARCPRCRTALGSREAARDDSAASPVSHPLLGSDEHAGRREVDCPARDEAQSRAPARPGTRLWMARESKLALVGLDERFSQHWRHPRASRHINIPQSVNRTRPTGTSSREVGVRSAQGTSPLRGVHVRYRQDREPFCRATPSVEPHRRR